MDVDASSHQAPAAEAEAAPSSPDDGPDDDLSGADPSAEPDAGPDGFAGFYRREFPRVVGLLFPLTGSWAVAEDLAQDAFVAANRSWGRISGYDRPDHWVRRVATNRATSAYRRRRREQRALDRIGNDDEGAPEGQAADLSWLVTHIRRLPTRQAQAVALVYVEQWSTADAAAILECSESTLRTHLQRARLALQRAIDDEANP